ncbi:DUF4064 domain-containing protein [Listeria booriae]|uniref:Membrane protein n=1 Tax=Listeria booriae TaxID=1552123 RepID=A0A099VWQ9_9LIST|nr:DUF4064 domain-containing protein [Listeria booriae]KGL37954.1 membrane protein [Listeria booriae]STY45952.1 Uncharacterised protein [Listeria booriae]
MSRKAEMSISIIGASIGLIVGIWLVASGDNLSNYIQTFTYFSGMVGDQLATLGWITIVFSALALIAACCIPKHPMAWGIVILIIGILMFFFIGTAWVASGILLIIGGLVCVFRS